MSVALATRGMVRSCCRQDTIISLEGPVMQETIELRPDTQVALTPPAPELLPPSPLTAQEIRPTMRSADAPAEASPDPKPVQTSTQELRPKIVKAEEE